VDAGERYVGGGSIKKSFDEKDINLVWVIFVKQLMWF